MFSNVVASSEFGLTAVEGTSRAPTTMDKVVGGGAGESPSHSQGQFRSVDGGEGRGVGSDVSPPTICGVKCREG